MKNLILFLIAFLINLNIYAQCYPTAQTDLNINNVRARVLNGGDLWWNLSGDPVYIFPDNNINSTSALFAGALWLGAKDNSGNIVTAAQRHRSGGQTTDFYPGTGGNCDDFDRIWEIIRTDVMAHVDDYAQDGVIDNPITSIYSWPGKNNPESINYNGFDLPNNENLAPFIDINNDGIYNPNDGDYPDITGDQTLWWVFNDFDGTHQVTGTAPLNVVVHATAYAYASNEVNLNNTTFYSFTIINKGSQNLTDFYCGLWVDPDLGCPSDDFVGCIPNRGMSIVYNSNSFDANFCGNSGALGYQSNIPMLGIDMLKGLEDNQGNDLSMGSFTAFGAYNSPTQGDPDNGTEYYNYLTSKWLDGSPVTQSGNGYGGSTPFSYMYDGSPAFSNQWSECSAGNTGSDRKLLMASGPVDFNQNAVQRVDFAVISLENVVYPCPSLTAITQASDQIQDIFDNTIISNTNLIESNINNSLMVQPNPFSEQTTLDLSNINEEIELISIFDVQGKRIQTITPTNDRVVINRNNKDTGLYFFEVKTISNKSHTGKFIITD